MIFYFSGTGNSRYVAEEISKVTGDELISINNCIKENKQMMYLKGDLVFVAPTYGWRLPRIVTEFIRNVDFSGNNQVYFVLTCGGEVGNAKHFIERLCKEKHINFMGLASVVMPENYIAIFSAPNEEEEKAIIKGAQPKIKTIGETIRNREVLQKENVTMVDKIKSSVVNPIFYSMIVSSKGFYVTEKCISCGQCKELCPLNNIELKDNKPSWGRNCTHCMACICGCPKEAIEYKNNTKGKRRYYKSL